MRLLIRTIMLLARALSSYSSNNNVIAVLFINKQNKMNVRSWLNNERKRSREKEKKKKGDHQLTCFHNANLGVENNGPEGISKHPSSVLV